MNFPPITHAWFLAGPTASGKSAVAMALASRLGADIISMDSMAVYRQMDIGTAKPSADDRAAVKHHLLDVVEPDCDFSISEYLRTVHQTVDSLRREDRPILFVGGTPLYLKALLHGFDDGPEADWELRSRLEREADERGDEALHRMLSELDPLAASKIHPHDRRRTIRALEYFEKTGEPISSGQVHFKDRSHDGSTRLIAFDWPRSVLHARINERVEAMFREGWVEEVRGLLDRHESLGRTAAQAVGYREILALLRGEINLPTAIERTQAGTRQLARRQLIWLRSLAHLQWVPADHPFDAVAAAEKLLSDRAETGKPECESPDSR
ncbi:MAG: tRNA (adenosine(37)-N6)-dimethylallyltransferase MiaA [Planctomycetota bacterium]|nr:tRNA (adenosine(37)-N6)-dimethylallyltransferase MiaA [Planctomycetota bacterium]